MAGGSPLRPPPPHEEGVLHSVDQVSDSNLSSFSKSKVPQITMSTSPSQEDVNQFRQHSILNKSYAQAVQANLNQASSLHNQLNNSLQMLEPTDYHEISTYQGKPSVIFPLAEKHKLVERLKYVLVGKFSHGRPSMDIIRKFFINLKLKGDCNSVVFDKKHIFIECVCKEDYYRLWLNLKWVIHGYVMRVFKWSPHFSSVKESAIAPVWIRVEGLPLYLFDERSLLSISKAIGSPIKVDTRNVNRSMLHSARICVELDVCKPLLEAIQISFKDETSNSIIEQFWVKVYYDEVPLFCSNCCHVGHGFGNCKRSAAEITYAHLSDTAAGIIVENVVPNNVEVAVQPCTSVLGGAGESMHQVGSEVMVKQANDASAVHHQPVALLDTDHASVKVPIAAVAEVQAVAFQAVGPDPVAASAHPASVAESPSPAPVEQPVLLATSSVATIAEPVFIHVAASNDKVSALPDVATTISGVDGLLCAEFAGEDFPLTEAPAQPLSTPIAVAPEMKMQISSVCELQCSQVEVNIATPVQQVTDTQISGLPKCYTPNTWAAEVEEIDRQEMERKTNREVEEVQRQDKEKSITRETQPTATQHKNVMRKVQVKKFHTDLPIDFDPMMSNEDDTERMSWSQLISGSIKLLARRSVSPVGRSSEKLIKLRNRVDFLDHDAGKTKGRDKEEYLKENEEFFQAKIETNRKAKGQCQSPPTSGPRRSKRNRGRNRYRCDYICEDKG